MILIRHGQSAFNAAFSVTRIDPGIRDPGLTEEGWRQARAAAEGLRGRDLARLICSPYTRAIETASVIAAALSLPVTIEPLVRERFAFTCDIGCAPQELARRWPALDFDGLAHPWWHDADRHGPEESEDLLHDRCRRFRARAASWPDWRRVVVVTHWGFIRGLTGRAVTNCETVAFDPIA
jgi:broad specificity phosphatase PhoE